MKIRDLFDPPPDPTLPPVPARFPPCCHEAAREVMAEWRKAGRSYTVDELAEEVGARFDRARRKMQPAPPLR